MIPPAVALAVILADLQAQLAEAREQIAEDRAEIGALIENALDTRRYARQVAIEVTVEARSQIIRVLAEGRQDAGGDLCDYDDPASIAAMNAEIDAEGDIAPRHPESVRELDPDGEALLAVIAASIAASIAEETP
jgi:hypothetical protein